MAQRRMFSPDIVESEEFLDMPHGSQSLYFHLAMRADDDGFTQPRMIMRLIGANRDDLNVLISKRFVLPFESGVVVIKHWLVHNWIRKERHKETRFQKEKKSLYIKENRSYTDNSEKGVPAMSDTCQTNDVHMSDNCTPQVRLGKVRLGKDSHNARAREKDQNQITPPNEEDWARFMKFWESYPKKTARPKAWDAWTKLRPDDETVAKILESIEEYKKTTQWQNTRYIPQPHTFLSDRRWEDEIDPSEFQSENDSAGVTDLSNKK